MKTSLPIFTSVALAIGFTTLEAQEPYLLRASLRPEASSPQASAFFGANVAADGEYVVVGAPLAVSISAPGSSLMFVYHSATGALVATLAPGKLYSSQGAPLAVSGRRVVVGVPDVFGVATPGAVVIYDVGSATPAVPVARWIDPSPGGRDKFGAAVAISGNRLVVGAPSREGIFARGVAYVYDLGSATPTVPTAVLESPAGLQHEVGSSVAISGTRVVIGSSEGHALAYELTSATPGAPIARLADPTDGPFKDMVVAVAGNRVVVGSPGRRPDEPTGRAFVYDLSGALPPTTGPAGFLRPVLTLENPAPSEFDEFGRTVAISGNRVAIGAPGYNAGDNNDVGVAYLYDLESGTPTVPAAVVQNPMPEPADPFGISDRFGEAVALAGARLVIGAPWDNPVRENAGAAFLYDLSGPAPAAPSMLPNPTIASFNYSGDAVAIAGDLVAVGARFDSTGRQHSGSVRVYQLANATPTIPVATLRDSVDRRSSEFGKSVGASGTRVAVAAYHRTFVYDLASPTPTVPMVIFEDPEPPPGNQFFGHAVAIWGDRVVVSRFGEHESNVQPKLYVYDLGSATPTTPVRILPSPSANFRDAFGESVAIAGDLVVVGAHTNTDSVESGRGVAYVFDLGRATPSVPVRTFRNPRPHDGGDFGFSVAVSGQRVVIGAPGDLYRLNQSDAAYIYDLDSPTPTIPVVTLQYSPPSARVRFGDSVTIDGSRVVIGAPQEPEDLAGTALVFNLASPSPSAPVATLRSPNPNEYDLFGAGVAISGNQIVVGAPGDSAVNPYDGAAFVFRDANIPPPGDADGDGLSDLDEINSHRTNPNLFDTDGDLVGDGAEVRLASIGFNPLVDSSTQRALLQNDARSIGLYRASDVQNLALTQPLLIRDFETGRFQLRLGVERSPNLTNWTPLSDFTATQEPSSGEIVLDFAPGASGAEFYRVLGRRP